MEHKIGNLRVNPVLAEVQKDSSLLTRQEFICEFENVEPMVIKVCVFVNEATPDNLIGEARIEVESVTSQDNQQKWYDLYNDSKVAGRVMIRFRFDEKSEEDNSPDPIDKARRSTKKRLSEEIFFKISQENQDAKPSLSLID